MTPPGERWCCSVVGAEAPTSTTYGSSPRMSDRLGLASASHVRYTESIKSMTIPALRGSSQLRREAEAVLEEVETLSSFMLDALQKSIAQRRDQQAFLSRGIASAAKARRTQRYVSA